MSRVEVITSVQRRRRWSREEKERIVAASLLPGAVASEVARRADVSVSQLFHWRRQLYGCPPGMPTFAAVDVVPEPVALPVSLAAVDPPQAVSAGAGTIEIELAAGARIRLTGR